MNLHVVLVLWFSVCVCVWSYDCSFGVRTPESQLVQRKKVAYGPLPWMKRITWFVYNDTLSHRPIKAMVGYDLTKTEAFVNVTAGGLGYDFATLRMESQTSYGLEYIFEIYA